MKKNIIFNKYYRNLRQNVFSKLDMKEFTKVYAKFKRLSIQYRLLKIATFLEKLHIPKVEILLFRFIFKLIDFIRWKVFDLIMLIINGRQFNLFGVTIFCGRQRFWKNNGNCRTTRTNKATISKSLDMYKYSLFKTRFAIGRLATIIRVT